MEDITPELLKKIQEDFQDKFDKSELISSLYEKVRDGTATYNEANQFAIEAGDLLAKSYSNNISSEILPDGKMYYNIAQRVISPTMENNYNLITDVISQVQQSLNEAAGIGIKPIVPELNHDRIEGIINRLVIAETFDDIAWILGEPIRNFSQSIVDDSIRANAEFHARSGMSPKIVRKLTGGCCDWCKAVAGTYSYPDVPKDVYRRHQRCRCTVDYNPGDGKIQNVHSKKWRSENGKDNIATRRTIASGQNYLPVSGTEMVDITDRKMGNLHLLKINGYDEVYVQDGVKIKPKALHQINQNILSAIKTYNGNMEFKPKIVVVDSKKIGSALGKYDCVQNIIYVTPQIGDKKQLSEFIVLDKTIKMGSTEYHETWHWMQAQGFEKQITYENRDTEYMPWLLQKSKKNIESIGITEYNVGDISNYAKISFLQGRFDEVEAEYYLRQALKRGD